MMSVARRIVLVEDNVADVGLVREALRQHEVHCDLHVISDGESVLRFIDSLDCDDTLPCPDLVLLDLHLPKRNGAEILHRLRASERCARTPVLVMTSFPGVRAGQQAEEHAMLQYFHKPSTLKPFLQLGAIVKDVITRRDPQGKTP
jgi:CheY-like chemotaxis protein